LWFIDLGKVSDAEAGIEMIPAQHPLAARKDLLEDRLGLAITTLYIIGIIYLVAQTCCTLP